MIDKTCWTILLRYRNRIIHAYWQSKPQSNLETLLKHPENLKPLKTKNRNYTSTLTATFRLVQHLDNPSRIPRIVHVIDP